MTSLDYNELLKLIMNYAHDLLEVEATSVWTLDSEQGTLTLQVATGSDSQQQAAATLPIGTGIVGQVVAHGKRQIVSDMQAADQQGWPLDGHSDTATRSILCVPLSAPRIQLGSEQGAVDAEVIGAVQALNKRDGTPFSNEDILLFESFANQAATALQMARLYKGMQRQFRDTITTVANLVDARDAYTHGHSQRVSDFAVAIGRELGLGPEKLYEIAIGGILHDVGKIGVSDTILNKQGKLTDEEFAQIKRHPTIGYTALQNSNALRTQLPGVLQAVLEHHKRLDGSGYPPSENDEPISLIGRIMAVADVFDALTSERTYRAAWSAESTLAYLHERAGTEFDPACVAALQRAHDKGDISTQMQRSVGEDI
jgi:HD-GYP domain-containing protein (c-di-GMP phosphodiesterase class II)